MSTLIFVTNPGPDGSLQPLVGHVAPVDDEKAAEVVSRDEGFYCDENGAPVAAPVAPQAPKRAKKVSNGG
jgi:hypothetical protein